MCVIGGVSIIEYFFKILTGILSQPIAQPERNTLISRLSSDSATGEIRIELVEAGVVGL